MKRQTSTSTNKPRVESNAKIREPHNPFSAELPLHELRQTKAFSQVNLAKALHVHQAAISKMEHRTDMYISTLREYIRAMGGDLEIVARFPDGAIKISNFDNRTIFQKARELAIEGMPAPDVVLA